MKYNKFSECISLRNSKSNHEQTLPLTDHKHTHTRAHTHTTNNHQSFSKKITRTGKMTQAGQPRGLLT